MAFNKGKRQMFLTSHKWQAFRRKTWQTYQHYRNIRVLMLLLERKFWPPDLETRIETELIPILENGSMPEIKLKIAELHKERIEREYKLS